MKTNALLGAPLSLQSLGLFRPLHITGHIDHGFHRLTLNARLAGVSACCPACGIPSARSHGHYWRSLADLPCLGRPVVLRVPVRRFRCVTAGCPRQTVAEPLPDVAPPRARQTGRLQTVHQGIGLALGGNAGARLCAMMAVPVSATTLLHRVRHRAADPVPPPRVLGVDDWAWRKGYSYGTILCDLERRRVIDLLPDRKAETLAAWLKRHPSVAIVVRDRSGAYADGARHGAPQAVQIADRWHLLCNGSAALRELLDHHHRDLRDTAQAVAARMAEDPPAQETTPVEPESPAEDPALTRAQARSLASRQRRQARFEEAVRLREQGLSMRATARTLGIERKTLRRWLRAGQAPTWRRAHRGRSILDPFRPYLDRRWNEGCHNAAALWRELHEQGFPGGPSIVRPWATRQRQTEPAAAHPRPRAAPPPTPRKAARRLMADPDTLSDDDRRFVAVLRERSAPIARAADLMQRYAALVKGGSAGPLDGWITEAEVGGFPGFAASLRQDDDAVQSALSEPWSTGQVEGQINRLKVIKRDMYGRAGFELLRSRVLAAA